jgi:luciferase family oxidoreductase group 1
MIPYSVLDLAIITKGSNAKKAIDNSRNLALHAEKLGYNRFWMAEHHNMEHIASSSTSILLANAAEATSHIRIGSGGIMLPNHSPLIIAEQFGTLATMYPNRIDLGLGRAPGTDQVTAQAISTNRMQEVYNFPRNVQLLQHYLSDNDEQTKVRAFPGNGTNIPLWILGSSTDSAYLAAQLGLPYAFASHFAPQLLLKAIEIYRTNFEPSDQLKEPYVMAGINVIAADDNEYAEYLSSSTKKMFAGIITAERAPLSPPVALDELTFNSQQEAAIQQMLKYSFVGNKNRISEQLDAFIAKTNIDEVIVASYIYDFEERLKSHTLFAEVMHKS